VVVKEYQRLPTKLLEELCQKEKRLIPRYSESKRKPGDNPHRFSVRRCCCRHAVPCVPFGGWQAGCRLGPCAGAAGAVLVVCNDDGA
jgi:hypothetical protein